MNGLRIGEVAINAIVERASMPLPFASLLPDSIPEWLERERDWIEPRCGDLATGLAELSFHSYLLRMPRATVLIDACIGNDKPRDGYPRFDRLRTDWLQHLEAAGAHPESIDFVLCTHLHPDHIGWNTRLRDGRWVPTFPNARYVFARREYEHRERAWRADPRAGFGAFGDSVLPVVESGQAIVVETDHALDEGLRLESAPGHTPGNVIVHLHSREQHAIFAGDVAHHPVQICYPEWSARFCEDRALSAATRRQFVERYADRDTLILPAHFPAPSAGHIRSRNDGRWRFAFLGSE